MTKNTIYTIGQYITQGFTAEEAVKVREHDIIFNRMVDGIATEEEENRLYEIQQELGL